MPEITFLPNRFRPGVGKEPHREGRRPLLPALAAHCPVLVAANALGYLVYSALAEGEAFQIRYLPDNSLLFSFFTGNNSLQPERAFSLRYAISAGSVGLWTEELVYRNPSCHLEEATIFQLRDALFQAGNLGVVPGAVGLLGATSFVTPDGWDAVYTGVLNNPQPPLVAALSVRVETDWFPFETEFRYVLQPGDSLAVQSTTPIGQVFFIPREPLTTRKGSTEEMLAFQRAIEEYRKEKANDQLEMSYGLKYSPAYARRLKGGP
ncbi:MAG: hypothetical protein JO112_07040 [Planctomycetes bacterium]|nr:hypothetical protein [Planctomycetota bacterium]